jgi:chaperonin cofactor prefoldin
MSITLVLLFGALVLLGLPAFAAYDDDDDADDLESKIENLDSQRDALEMRNFQIDSHISDLGPGPGTAPQRDRLELHRDGLEFRRDELDMQRDTLESRLEEVESSSSD